MSPPLSPARRLRLPRWGLRAALAAVLALALGELGLRWVLFTPLLAGNPAVARIRRASTFADPQYEDLHWELRDHFLGHRGPLAALHHAELGWTSGAFDPLTFAHLDDDPASGKRPVLLFGDSYAQGVADVEDSFQALLALSDIGRTHQLLNYGVGGYGADQVLLLLPRVLERYRERNPLIVIGLLVDDDFDRCVLSVREQPKPRLVLREGQLESSGPVPTYDERLGGAPSFTASYLWRALTRGTRWVPRRIGRPLIGFERLDREKDELARAIVTHMLAELRTRGLSAHFVAFHDLTSLELVDLLGWRDQALRGPLAAAGAPLIDMREEMIATSQRTGEPMEDWFDHVPARGGHYNARGNRVAFEALAAHLWPGQAARPRLTIRDWSERERRGPGATVEFVARAEAAFAAPELRPRLNLIVGSQGPTEVRYELGGGFERFEALAALAEQPASERASVELELLCDGEVLARHVLRSDCRRVPLQLDLRGAADLLVRVSNAGDGIAGDWIALAQPRFQ